MAGVDWLQDMTARWLRIMTAAGGGSTPLEEATRQISTIGEVREKKGRLKRHPAAAADDSTATVLSRQLIAGVLISDLVVGRLCALTGQTREQVLGQVCGDLPSRLQGQQLRALQAELSDGCTLLQDPQRGTYSALGTRVEELFRLAEEQASAMIDAARAEAAEITASAGMRPCPRCGPDGPGVTGDLPSAPGAQAPG